LKNPTPKQIAFVSASYILLGAFGVFLVYELGLSLGMSRLIGYFVLGLGFFGAAYYIILLYLKKYIYRKIKVIYKTIHQEKLQPGEKNNMIDIDSDIIAEVEKEVINWAENQRRELEQYKAWAEYRRNFVGDISHELKTPIFNIQGYIESLIEGGLEDEQVNMKFLKRAATNVERLQTIVQDLEAIARLESGEVVLEMQTFDIKDLVDEVFDDLEMKARENKVELVFKEGAANGFKVRADRERIRQVLTNLINNSIKYGHDGGLSKVAFYDMDKNILIEVADNGIGIPKQHLNHVFDRFYRVDKSRSRRRGGSGLGLSIVKHIIESHQQTINVRSTPGLGSTFGFTLEKAK